MRPRTAFLLFSLVVAIPASAADSVEELIEQGHHKRAEALVRIQLQQNPSDPLARFGEELDAEMKKAVWVKPEIVAQIEFLEWTEADRLRHSKFVGLREDKEPKDVVKEHVEK